MGTITVSNLGKAYKHYPARWSRLAEWISPFHKPRHTFNWVLQDVNFTVAPGEAVGIVGLNGAGKSTLLKMITGTVQPTTGSVNITGRVAALLELGMGFHPDFTGRQNAFMAGQLLGYRMDEIERLMPEIEAFAEIGDYIDQPVRMYSSGMQMRLAFSVATAVRPDILIVDEALSVGDVYFQHKSFQRIKDFRGMGTTLLIVSHDKSAIQAICDRVILLSGGTVAMEGDPEKIFDYYNAQLADHQDANVVQMTDLGSEDGTRVESGSREATIESVALCSRDGRQLSVVSVGQPIEVQICIKIHANIEGLVLGCGIKDRLGQMVFGTNTFHTKQKIDRCSKGEEYKFTVAFDANLGVGTYSVSVAIHAADTHLSGNYHWIDRAIIFSVVNTTKAVFVGVSWNEMRFLIHRSDRVDGVQRGKGDQCALPDRSSDIILANAFYGPMLVYDGDKATGYSLRTTGAFQEKKIDEVVKYLQEKHSLTRSVFVDVGANIGAHTIYAVKSGLFEQAISFEPDSSNYNLLKANLAINGVCERVRVFNLALSDKKLELQMELSDFNFGDHRIRAVSSSVSFGEELERPLVCVQSTTLDQFILENEIDIGSSLIWMDSQGHEGHIFSGAMRSFSALTGMGVVVSEFWPYGIERAGGRQQYFDFLARSKCVFDTGVADWQAKSAVGVEYLHNLYEDMLRRTEKESHPHTDLLILF